jgi:hypothetical protein
LSYASTFGASAVRARFTYPFGATMPRIDTSFLLLGAACLLTGVSLGIYMGINKDFQLSPVHAHINLVGWASLALFGLIYRAYPELSGSRLAKVHFWLAAPSALALPFGIYLAAIHQQPLLAIMASMVWLAGVIVFFVAVTRLTLRRA